MYYHFKVHREDGFWAECIEIDGCASQSEDGTYESLIKNLSEALNLTLDEPDENIIFPLPMKDSDENEDDLIKIKVDPNIALSLYFKHLRRKSGLTQKEVAEKLGYKSVWAYQKLERGKYSNLQLKTLGKIKQVFPELDLNLIFS
ncbi:MAG: type II toxin-antitoxin system HicB family antitoxin [Spirochaetes bacterium]|nr:type II toxin-antitoxin system HicB family antitoxin [Spirochaetota bacterium]